MIDYDLPAEHQIAARKAKKKTSTGGVIVLLAIFLPLCVELSFLKWHHRELERGETALTEWISPKILLAAGIAGFAFGLGVIGVGFAEEGRVQKRVDVWRKTGRQGKAIETD